MTVGIDTTTILAVTGLIQLLSNQIVTLIKENATLRGINPDDVNVEHLLGIQKTLLDATTVREELLSLLEKVQQENRDVVA